MKVESVNHVKGRGHVACVLDDGTASVGSVVSDGERLWRVSGIERFATLMSPPKTGARIGLVLAVDAPPVVGAELTVVS